MIPDVFAADEALLFEVRELVAAGRLEVLITDVQVDELAATPDLERSRRLLNALCMAGSPLIETSATILGDDETNRAIDRLIEGRGVGTSMTH